MKFRQDLVPAAERDNLEVVQLTDESIPSSHIYMEAQIFTPDSRRLVLHRSAHPHGSNPKDPEHRYLVCDLEDHCRLATLTTELGTTAPSISPDGDWLYYFVDETDPANPGPLTLKRVRLDGMDREVIDVLDHPFPERISGSAVRIRSRPFHPTESESRSPDFWGTAGPKAPPGVCSSSKSTSRPHGWSFMDPPGAMSTPNTRGRPMRTPRTTS